MKKQKDDRNSGSTFDSFLAEQGVLEEVEAVALKRVMAWQLQQAMSTKRISKRQMAKQLGTSRSQVDRLLDPSYIGVSLATVSRAAHAVGKRIRLEIVDGGKMKAVPALGRAPSRSAVRVKKKRA